MDGAIVTFGIRPTYPATGYGYIERAGPLPGIDGVYRVEAFVEKPDAATAGATSRPAISGTAATS